MGLNKNHQTSMADNFTGLKQIKVHVLNMYGSQMNDPLG